MTLELPGILEVPVRPGKRVTVESNPLVVLAAAPLEVSPVTAIARPMPIAVTGLHATARRSAWTARASRVYPRAPIQIPRTAM